MADDLYSIMFITLSKPIARWGGDSKVAWLVFNVLVQLWTPVRAERYDALPVIAASKLEAFSAVTWH